MHLIPTSEEVIALLRETGALRDGHFEYTNGFHSSQHLEVALAMRSSQNAKILSVGLSRLLRRNAELRAILPSLSLVAATPSGLPIAYGLNEVLETRMVYWTEKPSASEPMRFPQYVVPTPGEKVIIVDDILRAGLLVAQAKALLESFRAVVVGIAVLVHQPTPATVNFGELPLYSLVRLAATTFVEPESCDLCRRGVPLENVGPDRKPEEAPAAPLAAGVY